MCSSYLHLAPRVHEACALARQSVLDGQLRDRDLTAEHLKDAVEIVAINDGAGWTVAFDRNFSLEVEVAACAGIFIGAWNREREGSSGHDDRAGTAVSVGGHDGGPQRDVSRRILAGMEVDRQRIEGCVHPEG